MNALDSWIAKQPPDLRNRKTAFSQIVSGKINFLLFQNARKVKYFRGQAACKSSGIDSEAVSHRGARALPCGSNVAIAFSIVTAGCVPSSPVSECLFAIVDRSWFRWLSALTKANSLKDAGKVIRQHWRRIEFAPEQRA